MKNFSLLRMHENALQKGWTESHNFSKLVNDSFGVAIALETERQWLHHLGSEGCIFWWPQTRWCDRILGGTHWEIGEIGWNTITAMSKFCGYREAVHSSRQLLLQKNSGTMGNVRCYVSWIKHNGIVTNILHVLQEHGVANKMRQKLNEFANPHRNSRPCLYSLITCNIG